MHKTDEARALALKALNEAPPAILFRKPLDYVLADHLRQRMLCRFLDEIAAETQRDVEVIAAALQFLKTDFGLHIIDEEEDLFPLLRRRTPLGDRLNEVMGELSLEHADAKQAAEQIIEGLAASLAAPEDRPNTPISQDLLTRFAANERRHLVAENAIILPLARAHLRPDDLRTLGKRMAARRGLDFPEAADAVRPA